MKIKTSLAILALFLSSCAQTKTTTLTITPIKSLPKSDQKKVVRRFVANVDATDSSGRRMAGGLIRTPKIVEVYDVGTTINAEGDLVGPHQLYRVVETETWAPPLKKRDLNTPAEDKPVPYKGKEKRTQITQASNPKPVDPPVDQRNATAEPAAEGIPLDIQKKVHEAFDLGPPEAQPDVEGLNKAANK